MGWDLSLEEIGTHLWLMLSINIFSSHRVYGGVVVSYEGRSSPEVRDQGYDQVVTGRKIFMVLVFQLMIFTVGDMVRVIDDLKKLKELQEGHGEYIETMQMALGKIGKVCTKSVMRPVRISSLLYLWEIFTFLIVLYFRFE